MPQLSDTNAGFAPVHDGKTETICEMRKLTVKLPIYPACCRIVNIPAVESGRFAVVGAFWEDCSEQIRPADQEWARPQSTFE